MQCAVIVTELGYTTTDACAPLGGTIDTKTNESTAFSQNALFMYVLYKCG